MKKNNKKEVFSKLKSKMLKTVLSIFIGGLLITSCQERGKSDNAQKSLGLNYFMESIEKLKKASIDSLSIQSLDSLKIKFLLEDSLDMDQRDKYKYESGYINLTNFKSLRSNDILSVTDRYIIVLLHHKSSSELRAATLAVNGDPIESLLLYSSFGNNEFKVSRTFSQENNIPYKFDSINQVFTFKDLRTDTEWINFPTKGKDVITYSLEHHVGINKDGLFSLIN